MQVPVHELVDPATVAVGLAADGPIWLGDIVVHDEGSIEPVK
jgi:hypothetical protein